VIRKNNERTQQQTARTVRGSKCRRQGGKAIRSLLITLSKRSIGYSPKALARLLTMRAPSGVQKTT